MEPASENRCAYNVSLYINHFPIGMQRTCVDNAIFGGVQEIRSYLSDMCDSPSNHLESIFCALEESERSTIRLIEL